MTVAFRWLAALTASLLCFVHAEALADNPVREATTPGAYAAALIAAQIRERDCTGAVERLKSALKEEHPEVELLGGTMYEHGVCVRRDWERAVILYMKAHAAGQRDAALRLTAGYADPANGPDIPGALWWSAQVGFLGAAGCYASTEAARDPELFVAELGRWAQERLAYCNYVVGVLSSVASEVRYPGWARALGVGGELVLRFLPAVPRVEASLSEARGYQLLGWVDADQMRDRSAKRVTGGFKKALDEVAARVLRRYPQPAGISADSQAEMRMNFIIEVVR